MASISKEKFLKYIKTDTKTNDYYVKAYDALIVEKKLFYWNWFAAFFQGLWLLYRRMYFEAFILNLGYVVLNGCAIFFKVTSNTLFLMVSISLGITIFMILGCFGTPLYVHSIKKRIEEANDIPSSAVDERVVHIAVWPSFVWLTIIHVLVISSETKEILELAIPLYLVALSSFKYFKARHDNIM